MKQVYTNRERAKKRVSQLKSLYSHITVYIIINIILFAIKAYYLDIFENIASGGVTIGSLLSWDILSTPIFWGVILVVHSIRVYSNPMIEKWETKQIQKYMQKEEGASGQNKNFK
ncbi:hypothetical protein HME9304_00136 [Flagellimonas maritima]|uniref:2TM domain-containing protein n=1 Tax=Flagellimonas maritima TaxID=1383885 RepID=A0A2Z4LMY9_9FLAO|nr:2TM domain-containing protein [Allomuricauda aurantiaca]AWX43149.1 hypothetical protein HME9304_00136 [Allomuricauda aurantiaca]